MLKLYLASANPGKLREFRAAALTHGIEVDAVPCIGEIAPCHEDGATFEANACKKALYYSTCVDGLVFADDSGIAVEGLGGGPGVFSARFAGPEAGDEANNQKLLTELRRLETVGDNHTPANRAAHYVCVIALAEHGRVLSVVEGRADGLIIDEPRGSGGFGYDPYFFFPPLKRTFAELSPEEKFAVSHRGEAFRKLLHFLEAPGPKAR